MRTSSGTSSLPIPVTTASTSSSTPPKADSDASFHDVMQQHGGDSSNASNAAGKASSTKTTTASRQAATTDETQSTDSAIAAEESASTDVPATPSTGKKAAPTSSPTPTTSKFVPVTTGTALSAMIVQAAAQISNARSSGMTKGPVKPDPQGTSDAGKDAPKDATQDSTPAIGLDLSNLIAQVAMLAQTGPQVPAGKTTAKENLSAGTDSKSSTSEDATGKTASAAPGVADISTLMAQATIQTTNAAQVSASTAAATAASVNVGKEIPSAALNQVVSAPQAKEKKSASTSTEGTFIQSGTTGTTTTSSLLDLLSSPLAAAAQAANQQAVTTNSNSTNLSADSLSDAAAGIAGTANVEKGKDMNALLNFPEIFSGYGTSTVPQQTPVDMHIQLSSNNDFNDALKQVMHVAQLTQTNESRAPMRVAIEIQTPPGAIVNVYVSRQNDQWRAQLSTSDTQALSWVQDKMTSLRQTNDLGVDVKWLPPQIESTATSASNESNLGWDRGNQNQQSFQQQQDERQQSGRQKRAEVFAGIGSGQFMETLTAVGSAA